MNEPARFTGKLYRALNPIWAASPLSGEGAARHGGRFNPVGMPALYCALSPLGALREANQAGDLQPTILVAYDADICSVFDARDVAALDAMGITPEELAYPGWRDAARKGSPAPTQIFARRLVAAQYRGLLVHSFARGATPDDINLVLFDWGNSLPAKLVLIDDEGRLGGR